MTATRTVLERIHAAFNARGMDTVLACCTRQWALIDPRVEPPRPARSSGTRWSSTSTPSWAA